MGKLAVNKFFSLMFLIITVMLSIFTFFGLFGGSASPKHQTAMAMLVYLLPFLVGGNLFILIYWLIRRRWHWSAIPVITLLCCIPYIGTFYQTGWFQKGEASKSGFKIATYNVALFGREISGFKAEDILSEMKRQNVEILCMQEYAGKNGDKDNTQSYKTYFPHLAMGHSDMVIFSRHPIVNHGTIEFGDFTNNSAMWADIDVNGTMVRVFSVHLETTGFNRTLYRAAKMEMQGNRIEENKILKALFGNYTLGMIARAGQADIVAHEIKKSKYPVILCGDFNDVPYSYTYNTMKGDLVDGFKECGKGRMFTMRGKKQVRIDYIFHDESLSGEHYYKMDISYSDHYPVFMKIVP